MLSLLRLVVLLLVGAAGGCATHFENRPLDDGESNVERRSFDVGPPDRPLVLVAISGGGSRAAALGWVVLRELSRKTYESPKGTTRRLSDDIAVLSSVSGGSVIAAHFALEGAQGLERFEGDFLRRSNTQKLVLGAINPFGIVGRGVSGGSRTDLVEEMLDDQLFGKRTFKDLNQPGRPFLVMNATDMTGGEVFAFTPRRFDDICSDLDSQRVSTGVAASASVPILFAPIALENFSESRCQGRPIPHRTQKILRSPYELYINPLNFREARYTNDLRHGPDAFRKIDYVYLVDGGLADNLAIHGLLDAMTSPYAAKILTSGGPGKAATIAEALNKKYIKKLVVVLVNARSDQKNDAYVERDRPGLIAMFKSVTSIPIDATSFSVSSQLEQLTATLNDASGATDEETGSSSTGMKVYAISVDFDQLLAGDPIQRDLRDQAKQIPTLWTVTGPQLDVIEKAGVLLLNQHPCFQRLVSELSGTGVIPERAKSGCGQAVDRPPDFQPNAR